MSEKKQNTILITGGTGLIGSALTHDFLKSFYKVIILTRHPEKLVERYRNQNVQGISSFDEILPNEQIDYVINLAGESIGGKPWTESRRKTIISSRVDTTNQLVKWLKIRPNKPQCIISGSAVGYYGINEQHNWQTLDEDSPSQPIFMSELCQKWENAILPLKAENFNIKIIRLGVVFARHAPALKQMLLPIKLNTVGKIASGKQPISWIHIEDLISAIHFLLHSKQSESIYNLTAPDLKTQKEFVQISSEILKKTPFLPLPEFPLKCILGEQSQLITNGQFVYPKHLIAENFEFKYPTLKIALNNILK